MYGVGFGIGAIGATTKRNSGVAIDADAQAFFTANSTLTDVAQKNAINQFYVDTKSFGIYSSFKAFWFTFLGSSTKNSYNGFNPSLYQLNFTSGWSHSSSGITPTNAYANTFLNLDVLSQNSFSMGFYSRTNTSGIKATIGAHNNSGIGSAIIASNSGSSYYEVNDSWNTTPGNYLTNTTRLICVSRINSTTKKLYRDGSVVSTVSNASNVPPSSIPLYIGNINQNNSVTPYPDNKELSFVYVSDGLTDTQISNLNTCVNTLMTTLGINV